MLGELSDAFSLMCRIGVNNVVDLTQACIINDELSGLEFIDGIKLE
jgi:hypothetical protein